MRNSEKDWLQYKGRVAFSFGRGGVEKGALSHLSTICCLINGFRANSEDGEVHWPGISSNNK